MSTSEPKSKFSSLLQARDQSPAPSEQETKISERAIVEEKAQAKPSGKPQKQVKPAETIDMSPQRGKRDDPDYAQITVYLRKDSHKKAKIALLQSGDVRDFSELMEDLLSAYLKSIA